MNQLFRNQKGEIATILTLITVGLMGIGVAVGSYLAQHTTQLQSNAADCATISDVTQSPDSDIDPEAHFTCNVTIDQNHSGSKNISCGWSKNGDWPQTGGFWDPAATCAGINCTFGIAAPKENEITEGAVFELVGFDMSPGCGPQSGMRKPFKLKGAKEPPPGDDENICKDKPDGYRAKYDVHEECDTALKKWVIIDGICRDGEVKNEPACATCDSCGDGDTTRDAKASSLARNECTPRGCDAPPPDDNGGGGGGGGGNGGGSGNGNNSNWCTKPDYNPVTCHVGPILLNQPPCFEASFCRDSTFTCDTISNYFKPFTDYFKSFLPQDLIKNIFQSNVCSDKSCPSDESRLQCHGTDPEGECYAVSLCTKESKCSDVAGPAQALVNLQDGPCPLPKDDTKPPPNGTNGKIGGNVIVFNPDSHGYHIVKLSICEAGGGKEKCTDISAQNPDQRQIVDGQPAKNNGQGGTLSWKYSFDSDGNSKPIALNTEYRIVSVYAQNTNPPNPQDKYPGKIDDAGTIKCTSFPCGKDFVLKLGTTEDPLSITGTVKVINASPEYVSVQRCKKNTAAYPNNTCSSDPNAVIFDSGDGLYHFTYYTDGDGVTLRTGQNYILRAEARDADRTVLGQASAEAEANQKNIQLEIIGGVSSGKATIKGTIDISGPAADRVPQISLCDVDAQNQIILSNSPNSACTETQTPKKVNGTQYAYQFSNVSPVMKSVVIWQNDNPVTWDACSTIKATCPSGPKSNMDNACIIPVAGNTTYTVNYALELNDPNGTILSTVKVKGSEKDLFDYIALEAELGKGTVNNPTFDSDTGNSRFYPMPPLEEIFDSSQNLTMKTYAFCGLKPDAFFGIKTYLKKGDNILDFVDRAFRKCESSSSISKETTQYNLNGDQRCVLYPPGTSNWVIGVGSKKDNIPNITNITSREDLEIGIQKWLSGDISSEQLSTIIHNLSHTFGLQMDTCNPQRGECSAGT